MAHFDSSTQKEHWMLTEESLKLRREEAYSQARNLRLEKYSESDLLSPSEESVLLYHHTRRMLRLSRKLKLPLKVGACAVMYMKRFYVDASVMDHNPSVVALCALYAACKIEEIHLSAEELVSHADVLLNNVQPDKALHEIPDSEDCTAARVGEDMLLQGELEFLQRLQFHLIVYHPFRSIRALQSRIARMQLSDGLTTDVLEQCANRADEIVIANVIPSDIPLLRPPGIIAAGALLCALRERNIDCDVGQIIAEACGGGKEEIKKRIEDVCIEIGKFQGPIAKSLEEIAKVEERRRKVRDVLMDPTTEEYSKMKEKENEEREEVRRLEYKESMERQKRKAEQFLMGTGDASPKTEEERGAEKKESRSHSRKRSRVEMDERNDDNSSTPARRKLDLAA